MTGSSKNPFMRFCTNEKGLKGFDTRLHIVLTAAHEYLRFHAGLFKIRGVNDPDRFKKSYLPWPKDYHVSDAGHHWLCSSANHKALKHVFRS